MTFASSGLVNAVAAILDMTASQASTYNVATPGTQAPIVNQIGNSYSAVGVNSGPSTSLATPTQGTNGNPSGDYSVVAPAGLLNLESSISNMAAYPYRI